MASPSSKHESISADQIDNTFSSRYINLASSALESRLIDVSDDFFASASNLLNPRAPISKPGTFVETGAWYDGWETRRHNSFEYDYVIVRLGVAAGKIHGIEVDTAFFNGNHAPSVSVEALYDTSSEADERVKSVARSEQGWSSILPRSETGPTQRHAWMVSEGTEPFTHVRLRMYPDGGIARFRVYGTAVPVWPEDPKAEIELSAAQMGGVVISCSDQHYGTKDNLILPGRGFDMGDGWETKRSRGKDHVDWAIVRLGARGHITRVIVDTMHFRGNFPQAVRVEAAMSSSNPDDSTEWKPVVVDRKMKADEEAECELVEAARGIEFNFVRMTIIPDGGVKRLRVFGTRV